MAKLTLKTVKKAAGIGTFVEKTIKFRDASGKEFEGEILVKIISHDERNNSVDAWGLKDRKTVTLDQATKAILFETIYSSKDERFFAEIGNTGEVSSEVIDAMWKAADEVIDFAGKKWISKQMNSGANLSSTELAEEQLNKLSET